MFIGFDSILLSATSLAILSHPVLLHKSGVGRSSSYLGQTPLGYLQRFLRLL